MQAGDLLQLSTTNSSQWFVVRAMEVVDSRRQELVIEPGLARISLVTCFPFDSFAHRRGPLRYVVTGLARSAGVCFHPADGSR